MRSDSPDECPLCAGVDYQLGPDGASECRQCGWIDEGSLVDNGAPHCNDPQSAAGHARLEPDRRSYEESDLKGLSSSQRSRALRLRRAQTWEDRISRSKNEDPRAVLVVDFLRNVLLSDRDPGVIGALTERVSIQLRQLRSLEKNNSEFRIFRNGCEFGVEAVAVCLMELIDRENGAAPPDTRRRVGRICYTNSLDRSREKRLMGAIRKTRRAIKGLLCQGMRDESRPKGVWDAPVASSCRSAEVRMGQINTIVERRISDSGVLGWSDRSRLMEICGSILKRLDETESSHVRLSTVVEMGVLTLGRERRPGDPLRKIVEDMGISKTVLNHTSKLPTVAPAA